MQHSACPPTTSLRSAPSHLASPTAAAAHAAPVPKATAPAAAAAQLCVHCYLHWSLGRQQEAEPVCQRVLHRAFRLRPLESNTPSSSSLAAAVHGGQL